MNFSIIIVLILAFMVLYSKSFVQQVTDPIHVMNRGFKEADYFLEVKIKPHYETDDIFVLAKEYNEKWLTFKEQNKDKMSEPEGEGKISMDDFLEL